MEARPSRSDAAEFPAYGRAERRADAAVHVVGLALLAAGGVLHSVGAGFHLWRGLPFQNAVWHGFVLAAAACHYAAGLGEVAAA